MHERFRRRMHMHRVSIRWNFLWVWGIVFCIVTRTIVVTGSSEAILTAILMLIWLWLQWESA